MMADKTPLRADAGTSAAGEPVGVIAPFTGATQGGAAAGRFFSEAELPVHSGMASIVGYSAEATQTPLPPPGSTVGCPLPPSGYRR
jgi:hypothetical protein